VLQTIAIHDARPEHADAMLAFMRRVEDAVAGAPGLIDISSHRDTMSGRLVAIARWETQEAFTAAMPAIMSLSGERDPAWTDRPDEVLAIVAA
jgi:quinol monooxygenase YgiN